MNLPNTLTVSRFFLVPVFAFCFFFVNNEVAFVVLLISGITDVLDGHFARKFLLTSETGAMLDPLADKAMMVTTIAVLVADARIHWLIGLLVGLREICMIAVALMGRSRSRQPIAANQLGKWTTIIYYALFSAVILGLLESTAADVLVMLTFIFSIFVSAYYARLMFGDQTKKHIRG